MHPIYQGMWLICCCKRAGQAISMAMAATFVGIGIGIGIGSDLAAFRSATQALCDRYRN